MIFTGTSFAQPPWLNAPAGGMAKAFMDHEDADGDGKVTIEEFKGPDNEFHFFDRNGDGVIEISEAATPDNLPDGIGEGVGPEGGSGSSSVGGSYSITINGVVLKVNRQYDLFPWAELPHDVIYERQPVQAYTNSDGVTHYYETVYVSSGNLNWYQSAYLAQEAGGYLASITSEGENTFVFNLVSDKKFFWFFEEDGPHYGISIGPFLGGYQPEGSPEPAGGWRWLSGEPWSYTNWCKNLDDGVIDKDPRPNNQPNDSGTGQAIMGFGEMNLPVATWGDYMGNTATYGGGPGSQDSVNGFVIEYERNPNN